MGGVSTDSGGKGGRKSVDQNVNMVPMIDLLISVIAFLLMTAVWVQTGVLQASQPKNSNSSTPPTPDGPKEQLSIIINDQGYRVGYNEANMADIRKDDPRAGEELRTKLKDFHEHFPTQNEVKLKPDSAVHYLDIIKVMDAVYEIWGATRAPNQTFSELVTMQFE